MRFMIIAKASAVSEAGTLHAEQVIAAMAGYYWQLARAGVLLDGQGLQPSSRGWRIRWSGAGQRVVDGLFAPTRELIAGYTLIQVRSREEALEWSQHFPAPQGEGVDAQIEVRPLLELEERGPSQAMERFRLQTPDA